MFTPKPQEGKGDGSYVEKPLCSKGGTKHYGKFLVITGNCYGEKRFPMMKAQGRENTQVQASAPNVDDPKTNCFYALQS